MLDTQETPVVSTKTFTGPLSIVKSREPPPTFPGTRIPFISPSECWYCFPGQGNSLDTVRFNFESYPTGRFTVIHNFNIVVTLFFFQIKTRLN